MPILHEIQIRNTFFFSREMYLHALSLRTNVKIKKIQIKSGLKWRPFWRCNEAILTRTQVLRYKKIF